MEPSGGLEVAGVGLRRSFLVAAVLAGAAVALYLLWILVAIGGTHMTLQVDDVGQWVAAWCATAVCCVAAFRAPQARATWALFAVSSFAWGAGEAVWCYYALLKDVPVPFPSLADVGFLSAIPPAFAALLVYPGGRRSAIARVEGVLDGCIIATSLLFASWATILGPLFRDHRGSVLKQVISVAYPMSDVVMVSLVVILIARGGSRLRVDLALVMSGVVAFAVADSSFTYLTAVNSYSGGNYLDTGWVAGYLLIALGAWWAMTSRRIAPERTEAATVSLVAPYIPVLIVLAVTSVQLLRGKQMEPVSWFMALALVLMVLGREALNVWHRTGGNRRSHRSDVSLDDRARSRHPDIDAVGADR
ncbi:MAG: hypothetical protein ABSB09_11995 [Acidimicrobiales bacterium]|jgi:hypothetical protein